MSFCIKILIILTLEIILIFVFRLITPKDKRIRLIQLKSILKGVIERVFLTYSILCGYPHALTLFGALKLGTRLKSADNEATPEGRLKESNFNDYFLIGNFISVLFSIIYVQLLKI